MIAITSQEIADTYFDALTSPSTVVTAVPYPVPLSYHDAKHAFDNTGTKFLHTTLPCGVIMNLTSKQRVDAIYFMSGDDYETRDPASYELYGSDDGSNWTIVSQGAMPQFTGRYQKKWLNITGSGSYSKYKLMFPTNRGAGETQITEIDLLQRNTTPLADEHAHSEIISVAGGIKASDLNYIKRFKDGVTEIDEKNTKLSELKTWFKQHAEIGNSTLKHVSDEPGKAKELSFKDFEHAGVAWAGIQMRNEQDDTSGYGDAGNAAMKVRYYGGGDYGWTVTVMLGNIADATAPYISGNDYYDVVQVTAHDHDQAIEFASMGGTGQSSFHKHYTVSFFDRDPAWSDPGQAPVWNHPTTIPYNSPEKHLNSGVGHVTGVQTGIGNRTEHGRHACWFPNTDVDGRAHEGWSEGLHDGGFDKSRTIPFSWVTDTNKVTGWSNMMRCDFPAPASRGQGTKYPHSGDTGRFGDLPDGTSPDVVDNYVPPAPTNSDKMQITMVAGASCWWNNNGGTCSMSNNVDFLMIPFRMQISSDLLGYTKRQVAGVLGISARMYTRTFWEFTTSGIELLSIVPQWAPTSDFVPGTLTHWAKAGSSTDAYITGDSYSSMFIRLIDGGGPGTCYISNTDEFDVDQSIVKHPHPLAGENGSCTAFTPSGNTWPSGTASTFDYQMIGNQLGLFNITNVNRDQVVTGIPLAHSSKFIRWTDLYKGDFVVHGFEDVGYDIDGCPALQQLPKSYAYTGAIINNATSIGGKSNWTEYPFDLNNTI